MIKVKDGKVLVLFVLTCLGVGFVGGAFTYSSISEWYRFLEKPFLNPPNWVFGPVWTFLYICMGVAAYLIYQQNKANLLKIFWVHLGVNFIWSWLFFGLRNPGLALIDIIILWLLISYLAFEFYKVNKLASSLLWPYLAWVSFATYLNFNIWLLN